jgi:archaeosine synthase
MKTFEIRKQFGLARCGRITIGNLNISTPQLLFPAHSYYSKWISTSLATTDKHYTPPIGYFIQDPLHILPEDQKSVQNSGSVLPILVKSLNMWGIPDIQQIPEDSVIPGNELLILLQDQYPVQQYPYYEEYNRAALETRFKMYEEIIFAKNSTAQYILEIRYIDENQFLPRICEFIENHKNRIVGIQITDLFRDLGDFRRILDWVMQLKNILPPNLFWCLGGQVYPDQYALGIYLGFDLIDSGELFLRGSEGLYLTPFRNYWARELKGKMTLPCICPACIQLTTKNLNEDAIPLILEHNIYEGQRQFNLAAFQLNEGLLRTYMEQQTHNHPGIAALLRIMDRSPEISAYIQQRVPRIGDYPVQCIGPESYYRPEIQNYQQNLLTEVTPARAYDLVVLFPCAATKPYSQSKSHQKFIKVLRKAAGNHMHRIHQVIITSPLGVVPRELEGIFPVAHYDIPVTGDWDNEEIHQTGELIAQWLQKYIPPVRIIAHVGGGYRKACEYAEELLEHNPEKCPVENGFFYTVINTNQSAQAEDSLAELGMTVKRLLNEIPSTVADSSEKISDTEIEIRAVADYQFGKGAGEILTKAGAFLIRGKNPFFSSVFYQDGAGKLQIGNIFTNTGLIKLSPAGAPILLDHKRPILKIREITMQGTTIFKPLVEEITPDLHPGDEVLVINVENVYIGVGEMVIASADADRVSSGAICRLRKKKIRSAADGDNSLIGGFSENDFIQ